MVEMESLVDFIRDSDNSCQHFDLTTSPHPSLLFPATCLAFASALLWAEQTDKRSLAHSLAGLTELDF
jgi:hypothetical protein